MTASSTALPLTYQGALREYLVHADEASLAKAYDLGRAAMQAGLGIFDLIRLHSQALADGVLPGGARAADVHGPAIEAFLLEALSPFEAAFRGFRSARERLQQLNEVLAAHNAAFAESNALLKVEMANRKKIESELRENKDHFFALFQQAHAMEEDLRELSAKVLSTQEEERKRISLELHDEIAQALIAVNVAVAILKKQATANPQFEHQIAGAERLLTEAMETVHRFARELRPAMLDHLGLAAAMHAHLATFTRETGIKTHLVIHPLLTQVDGHQGEVLFRVAQEALTNIAKHAEATTAKVAFASEGDVIRMEISDNGRAFNIGDRGAPRQGGYLGVLGMQERMRQVNGTFSIHSVPGEGTCIRVQLPLDSAVKPTGPDRGAGARLALPATSQRPESSLYEKNIRAAG